MTPTPDTMDLFGMTYPLPDPYFNTVSERGAKLKEYTAKTANQNARVLDILRSLGSASPSQVWIAMGRTCPITSVRRALTTLTTEGLALKTEARHVGEYGRDEHVWTIAQTL